VYVYVYVYACVYAVQRLIEVEFLLSQLHFIGTGTVPKKKSEEKKKGREREREQAEEEDVAGSNVINQTLTDSLC